MALAKIFEPIDIGPVRVKNRIFRSAHGTWFGDGAPTDTLINYHLERARNEVGLSFLEVFSIHPTTNSRLRLWDPRLEDGYHKLIKAIEPHGMTLFQQLWHGGHNFLPIPMDGLPQYADIVPWGASDIPSVLNGMPPIPMTKWMIDEIVEAYAKSAKFCKDVGLQGVEVHASHGYLPQQFLSPNANKREDEYGGSFDNRMRFLLEVMRAVKAAVGEDFAVGVRLSPDLVENGVNVLENQQVIDRLQQENLVHFINLSQGSYYTMPRIWAGMHEPAGYELETSVPIAQSSKVVNMAIGRFRTLEEAEQVLKDTPIHMVGFTRAMIADPQLVTKTLAGQTERVRPCIGCNQGCVAGVFLQGSMSCAVNPAVGREGTLSEDLLDKAAKKKKVLVVGAGPAGLEASRLAALRGHQVVLFEAARDVGGAMNLAAKCPSRQGIRDIIYWQEAEVYELGVDVRMNTYVEAADILAERPDVVIIATGSYPRQDGVVFSHPGSRIENFAASPVLTSEEALGVTGPLDGQTAIVVDDLGHWEAIGVAEHFTTLGADVHFVTRHYQFAHLTVWNNETEEAMMRMNRAGRFHLHVMSRVTALVDGHARIEPIYGGSSIDVPNDLFAFVSVNHANRSLVEELRGKVAEVEVIGDAKAPRFLEMAIREGHMVGRGI